MKSYMLEVEIDGIVERKTMLKAMPESAIARLYEIVQTEEQNLLGEKVLM